MTNPRTYDFSYVRPEPIWRQLTSQARPVDPSALPPGPLRDEAVRQSVETDLQRSQRIADEAGRAARAADPILQIANQTGGNVADDPGESLAGVALSAAQDVIPGAVESGARLFGIAPDDAAEYGNEARDIATGAVRAGIDALPRSVRGAMLSQGSPQSLVYETVPFSDEMAGTFESVRTGAPWIESMNAASRHRAELAEQFPASAMTGQVAQGILSAPLFGSAPAASGVPSAWRSAVSGGLRAGREGGIMGTMIGADQAAARPFATLGSAMTGARQPDEIIPAITQFGAQVAPYSAMGAGASAAMGAATSGLGALYSRNRAAGQFGSPEAARQARIQAFDDAVASRPSADTEFLPGIRGGSLDDAQIEALSTPDAPQVGDDLASYRDAAQAIQDRPVTLRSIVDESFNNDPDVLRANAVGIENRNELRALRQNGGIAPFSEALDRYGIMPRGEIATTDTFRSRAAALRDTAGARQGALEDAWEEAVASGRAQPIDPGETATRIRVLADQYAEMNEERAASELYDFADSMVETRGVFDRGRRIASEPRDGLMIRDITHELIPRARESAMRTMDGSARTTAEARAWREVYSLLNDVRDEAMESGMGAQAIRDYRLARDAQRVARTVPEDGRSVRLAHRAGMMAGASLGGSVGEQIAGTPGLVLGAGAGALIGNAAGRRWVQYEPAVMAAMADPTAGSVAARARGVLGNFAGNLTSPVARLATPESANAVQRLLARAPDSLGRYSGVLADAARRGRLDVYLRHIERNDPDEAAAIQSAIDLEVPDSEALRNRHAQAAARRAGTIEPSETTDDVDDASAVAARAARRAAERAARRAGQPAR